MNNSCNNKLITIDDLAVGGGSGTLLGSTLANTEVGIVLDNNDVFYTTSDQNGQFDFIFIYNQNVTCHRINLFIVNCCAAIAQQNNCPNSCCRRGCCNNNSRCNTSVTFQTDPPCPFVPEPVILSPMEGEVVETLPLIISGTAVACASVEICISGFCIQTTADFCGNFSVEFPYELEEGSYTLGATTTLSQSECFSDAAVVNFTVEEYTVPQPEVISPGWDEIVYTPTPLITGSGIPGYTVSICLYEYEICQTAFVDANGFFSLTFNRNLTEGVYHLIMRQIDTNGVYSTIRNSRFYVELP